MPLVGTWMDGNALRPEPLAVQGKFDHIGHIAPAGIAQRGHFVDVYT